MISSYFYSLLSLESGSGVCVAAQHCWGLGGRSAGKGPMDTGTILENQKFNNVLDLFSYIYEKKINSTL